MRISTSEIEKAVGGVLIHNIADAQGHKALNKGHRLVEGDLEKLRALGKTHVTVGIFEAGDVSENDAATRIANAVAGENVTQSAVTTGRINFFADVRGVFQLNESVLASINSLDGVTIATIAANQVVEPKKMVATFKTIGLAISEQVLQEVERLGASPESKIGVRGLRASRVAIILTGSPEARERVEKTYIPPIQGRVQELEGTVVATEYVDHKEAAIAEAVGRAQQMKVDCIILAGETSIMDATDVTPTGIRQAGGTIEVYGAPVEPGNLLLLAYLDRMPIVGAPGCVKSRDINVVDLILPRLLAGEHVRKKDVVALANGGLLI